MENTDLRALEERRFAAQQALKAVCEALATTNPQAIFGNEKSSALDVGKLQSINNRWADGAADVLELALQLSSQIGMDALNLFKGTATPIAAVRQSGAGA